MSNTIPTQSPEGAMFYAIECDSFHEGWYKCEGEQWYFFKHCLIYHHTWKSCVKPSQRRLKAL